MSFTPDQLDQLHQWYSGIGNNPNASINIGGQTYGTTGVSHNDEGGSSYTPNTIIRYDPNQINTPGYVYHYIDPTTGNDSGEQTVENGGQFKLSDYRDLGQAIATVGSMYLGGTALAAAGAGSAAGIGGSGFAAGTGAAAEGAAGAAAGGSGAFLGEGVASGIPEWDAAYTGAGGTFTGGAGAVDAVTDTAGDFGPGPDPYDPTTMPTEADVSGGSAAGDFGPDPEPYDPSTMPTETDVDPNVTTDPTANQFNGDTSDTSDPLSENDPYNTSTTTYPTNPGTTPVDPVTTPTKPTIPTGSGKGTSSGGGTSDLANAVLKLLTGIYGANQQGKSANDMLDYLKERQGINDNMYKPGSAEYNSLWDEMSRKDAAAGRNSQYGPRSVDLGARVAQLKMDANTKLTSGIANNMAAAYNSRGMAGSNITNSIPDLVSALSSGGGDLSQSIINWVNKLV